MSNDTDLNIPLTKLCAKLQAIIGYKSFCFRLLKVYGLCLSKKESIWLMISLIFVN